MEIQALWKEQRDFNVLGLGCGKMRGTIMSMKTEAIMQRSSHHPSWLSSGAGGRAGDFRDLGMISALYLHLKSGCTDKERKEFQGRNVTT